MTRAIAFTGMTVRIGRKALIDGASASVRSGETVVCVGPNGAGKSTLIRALCGDVAIAAGSIALKDRDPRGLHPRELALHRAVLAQDVSVAFAFTAAEVVGMGASGLPRAALARAVDDALAEVDLDGFQDRIVGTLSGGEQQRVHLARTLVQLGCGEAARGPGVLMLDEPTASLDLRHQLAVVAIARRRAQAGTAVIAVVHDLNLAALWADRIIVLDRGRLVADATPGEVITEATVRQTFGVASAVRRLTEQGPPFVSLHGAQALKGVTFAAQPNRIAWGWP